MFRPRNIVDSGCWHIDDVGPANLSDEDQLEHLKMSWNLTTEGNSESISEYIKNSDQQVETDCYTGKGRFYQGEIAVTKFGTNCASETYCRNTDGVLSLG